MSWQALPAYLRRPTPKMRSALYWLTSTLIALICIRAAATPNSEIDVVASTIPQAMGSAPADPVRAILLGIGIMAVAYTYRRVWMNFHTS